MDPAVRSLKRQRRASASTPGGSGGREDCWSEAATEILIEAWGERYVSLNRGNLRQKDWKEVADAVNSRRDGAKPAKTDSQCKNRIDTLKKKFKVEKSKSAPSKWPFYQRLESLIGANSTVTPKAKRKTPAATLASKSKLDVRPVPYTSLSNSGESSFEDGEEEDTDIAFDERVVKKQHRMEDVDCSEGAVCRELARAILKFAEIYERIESSKQQRMMELEKQRMELTKELEFERINMFMDAQLELEKESRKRAKYGPSDSGKK